MNRVRRGVGVALTLAWLGLSIFLLLSPTAMGALLGWLLPSESSHTYPRETLPALILQHIQMVGISSLLAVTIGIAGGVLVTTQRGREFLPQMQDIVSLMQTIPPVAVIALAVPIVGFGYEPAVIALTLFSVLPVLKNTISGIESVDSEILSAASGMGMSWPQRFLRIELPLALPVLLAGIRTSVVINVGTATLGAVVGAGGLGVPIISGLTQGNNAFVLQGALATSMIAIWLDRLFEFLEWLSRRRGAVN